MTETIRMMDPSAQRFAFDGIPVASAVTTNVAGVATRSRPGLKSFADPVKVCGRRTRPLTRDDLEKIQGALKDFKNALGGWERRRGWFGARPQWWATTGRPR
jgi:hypothetical protein